MKMIPKVILFDMDGVLVDSLNAWLISLNDALTAFNQREVSREEFIDKYWGHDLMYNIEKMGLEREILEYCNSSYSEHIDEVQMYPDVKNTLDKLKRYKKGVITNTPRDSTMKILEVFNLRKYFNIVMTSDDVFRGKPSPEIVLKTW